MGSHGSNIHLVHVQECLPLLLSPWFLSFSFFIFFPQVFFLFSSSLLLGYLLEEIITVCLLCCCLKFISTFGSFFSISWSLACWDFSCFPPFAQSCAFASSGRLILALLWGFSCKAIQLAAHFLVAHLQQLECFFLLLLFLSLELGCFILPISSFSIS